MPAPVPRQREILAAESGTAPQASLTLLVIEDDPAGGLTVPEILDADGHRIRLRSARNLTEAARLLTPDVHCVLLDLDLALPGTADAEGDGLTALRQVLRLAPATPSSS